MQRLKTVRLFLMNQLLEAIKVVGDGHNKNRLVMKAQSCFSNE